MPLRGNEDVGELGAGAWGEDAAGALADGGAKVVVGVAGEVSAYSEREVSEFVVVSDWIAQAIVV